MIGLFLAVTLAGSPVEGYGHRSWSIDDGLPQSSVTAIAQDRDGWLHLGTFGGLARFDGQRFESHGAATGVGWSTVRITALMVDRAGRRWLGLQSGDVVRIEHDGSDAELADPPGLDGKPIWALAEIDGAVWVAGSGGVARHDGAWTRIEGAGATRAIASHDGRVWLGGRAGLQVVDGAGATTYETPVGELYALLPVGADLLLAGEFGVTAVDDDGARVVDPEPSHDLALAADGTVYVASGSRVRILGEPGGRRLGSRVRDVFVDREQVLWVGTDGHGLHRLVREDWTLVDVGASVLPLLEADDGALLVGYGCELGGIARIGPDRVISGMSGGCVRALARHRDQIVIGVEDTVARLASDGAFEPIADLDHDVLVLQSIGEDLFVGTEDGGAFRIRDGIPTPLPIVDRRILAIAAGPTGEVWFGAQDGLVRLVGERATRWSRTDGIPAAELRALRVDADGTVFMGSYGGGLGILRDGHLHRLTRAEGLAEDVVSAILDDGRGALWLHGNRGLTRLMRGDLEAWLDAPDSTVTVRRWATPEGNGGGQPAGIVLRDGSLALPTIDGVVRIDPSTFRDYGTTPSLTLVRAEIDGVPLVPNLELEVPAGTGRVEIELTAAILRHPELATFEYRVRAGGDDSAQPWLRVGEARRVQWAGFRPGRHRIDLRVANESGLYSPVTTLRFTLAAPWHERWVVRIGLGFAALLVVGAGLGWRARAARRHLAGLQREIDQRLAAEAEARALSRRLDEAERLEAVGRLAGGVAHDFNNLFAAIRGATSLLTGDPREVDRAKPVRTLEACVDRGARLTSQLLSFARKQHLRAHTFDVGARVAALEALLDAPLPEGVSLHIVTAEEPLYVLADPSALELAVVGLVLNARDALPTGGSITLRVLGLDDADARARWPDLPPAHHGAWVVLEVVDDGIGIPDNRLAKVLEPFYSTRSDATGLGLPSVLGFATQSGGALRLSSREGEGTRVSIVLPRVAPPAVLAPSPTPPSTGVLDRAEPARIVVVDDDDLVRSAVSMILRRAGHEPRVFADPTEALAALGAGLPCDLLVTDVLMPGLTGSELAARVLAVRPALPVLFISGFMRDVDAGALPGPLLAKPFGAEEVLAAVDAALGTTRRAARG